MKFNRLFVLVLATWSSATMAMTVPPFLGSAVQCPAIGENFSKLIAKLDAIKASVRDGANCSNVALKVKSLEDLLIKDREKIEGIIAAGRQQPLSPEQTEAVKQYAEQVTTKVAALYDLFSGSNKCFNDDDAESRMSSLAAFVGEASRLVGTLTGPWGTPIALGGQVVAGFLTGMDKVIKSRAGYDFSKRESWTNYVQSLCTYHSYRDQIEHLLNPQARLAQLNSIKSLLDSNIRKLSAACGDCQSVEPMNVYMAYNLGIRAWINTEIQRVEKESTSFWADISGRHLLSQARYDLQQFLIEREGPRFVNYQTSLASRQLRDLMFATEGEGRSLHSQISYVNAKAVDEVGYFSSQPWQYFRTLVIKPVRLELLPQDEGTEDLRYAWSSYRDRNLQRFRSTEATLQVAQGFCQFFRQAGLYTPQIRSACTSGPARGAAVQIGGLAQELAAAKVINGPFLNPLAFDPSVPTAKLPRNQLDSLQLLAEQLQPKP